MRPCLGLQFAAKNKGLLTEDALNVIQTKLAYKTPKTPLNYLNGLQTWPKVYDHATETMNRGKVMHARKFRVVPRKQGASDYVRVEEVAKHNNSWYRCHELYDINGRFIGDINHRGVDGELLLTDWEATQACVSLLPRAHVSLLRSHVILSQ